MHKVYKPNPFKLVVGIFIWLPIGLLPYGFLIDAFSADSIPYKLFSILISCAYLYVFVLIIFRFKEKIILTDEHLIFEGLFKRLVFRWDEMKEFGRYLYGFAYSWQWIYYVKTIRSKDEKKIPLGPVFLGYRDLLKKIFEKAKQAQFVELRSTSIIPFIRRYEPFEWDINEEQY